MKVLRVDCHCLNEALAVVDDNGRLVSLYTTYGQLSKGNTHKVQDLKINEVEHLKVSIPLSIEVPDEAIAYMDEPVEIGRYYSGWKVTESKKVPGIKVGVGYQGVGDFVARADFKEFAGTWYDDSDEGYYIRTCECDGLSIKVVVKKYGSNGLIYEQSYDYKLCEYIPHANGVDGDITVKLDYRGPESEQLGVDTWLSTRVDPNATAHTNDFVRPDYYAKIVRKAVAKLYSNGNEGLIQLLDLARYRAVEYYDQCKTNSIEGLSDVAEMISLLRSPTATLAEKGSDISYDFFKKIIKPKGKDASKSFLRRGTEAWASAQMTYDWSLAPIPEDMENILSGVNNFFSKSFEESYQKCANSAFQQREFVVDGYSVEAKTTATSTMYTTPLKKDFLSSIGLDPTCSNVWESLPLSFVLDMVIPIKDGLSIADAGAFFDSRNYNDHLLGECVSYSILLRLEYGDILPVKAKVYTRSFNDKVVFGEPLRNINANLANFAKTLFKILI